ncbi:MAG: hypothetical protein AAFY88_07460 [Acidobacteriota bacterium]
MLEAAGGPGSLDAADIKFAMQVSAIDLGDPGWLRRCRRNSARYPSLRSHRDRRKSYWRRRSTGSPAS